ncbi:CLL_HP2_G0005850.mRNA.1.CDS.1 [Saccharomyces cerevisiae]|nr:CLL_HP2_G0005850.mRNA.1.CDS.1 [Saccharomyces cerevisiae]CAI6384745.1 CLL_HP2_G0005850.mRNA.1.CDS.1 [Saccharomyces cerevisiae]
MINKVLNLTEVTSLQRKCRILESWFAKEHREPISRYQGPRESNEEYQFISFKSKTGFQIEEERKTITIAPN